MQLEKDSLKILNRAMAKLENGYTYLAEFSQIYDAHRLEAVIMEVAERMQDNYPYFHPFYAGQMLKPPHPVARIAYILSMWINPNNHALDGGRASSQMEKEAVAEIAGLFGWGEHLGHLAGCGTLANMVALWDAGKLNAGKKVESLHRTFQNPGRWH